MLARFDLCEGAALRICDTCRRRSDNHPVAAAHPHQPWVNPARGTRCPHWLAKPHAITPTDRRN